VPSNNAAFKSLFLLDDREELNMIDMRHSAHWFDTGKGDYLFFPFGVDGEGYRIRRKQRDLIVKWTCRRMQLPVVVWILGFVPLIDFWAPSLSASSKLNWWALALALAVLTAATCVISHLANRALYAVLLRDETVLDRRPTRSEQRASSGQFGVSWRNIGHSPFCLALPVAATAFLNLSMGLAKDDRMMIGVAAVMAAFITVIALRRLPRHFRVWAPELALWRRGEDSAKRVTFDPSWW
jgi:hypothetical protein